MNYDLHTAEDTRIRDLEDNFIKWKADRTFYISRFRGPCLIYSYYILWVLFSLGNYLSLC